MKRHVIEGLWRGYRSSQDRVVHREVTTSPAKIAWAKKTFCIRYTDGTTLELSVRECKPHERVELKLGYRELINDCFYAGVSSVQALCDLRDAKPAEPVKAGA